jgi:cyclase
MLRTRIIPTLLISRGGLVKTIRFSDPKYVGDPLNAVRIFNEKQVDELFVLDIDASVASTQPDYGLIGALAAECRMPLCYGGGVSTIEQIERIISLGVEKVSISTAALHNPSLVSDAASRVGSQSVVVVLDVRKEGLFSGRYRLYTSNGKIPCKSDPFEFALLLQNQGAGEIVVNSIDRDGTMQGYDFDLVARFRSVVSVPLTILGGAGSYHDLSALVQKFGLIGAAAGSLFVFKGKHRAVLLQYPTPSLRDSICHINTEPPCAE